MMSDVDIDLEVTVTVRVALGRVAADEAQAVLPTAALRAMTDLTVELCGAEPYDTVAAARLTRW